MTRQEKNIDLNQVQKSKVQTSFFDKVSIDKGALTDLHFGLEALSFFGLQIGLKSDDESFCKNSPLISDLVGIFG